ncbi:hypothetical protein COMA2_80173 [Candidatus Nitrospira nitrificans]|uniref:Uncharacterized protein n=1 Tax=Candidatus Nitrospira nitrificans TaxID=1742973 RepID=A0A0S4LUW8_9BACT|nr:hypothetical protein COMA2_80173 [Candidatus Nitrospira nitrificans]
MAFLHILRPYPRVRPFRRHNHSHECDYAQRLKGWYETLELNSGPTMHPSVPVRMRMQSNASLQNNVIPVKS